MCNLYTERLGADAVAAYFGVANPLRANTAEEVYPGYSGMVVRGQDGARIMQSMVWGFPLRLKGMRPESKSRPVNNIADLRKSMWARYARRPQSRCLIPLTAFAEAEGSKGAKTRTWFTLQGHPMFAWGGLWSDSAEWGAVYSGAMTDCNGAIRPVHDRMPVLLLPEDHDTWLNGSFDDLIALQERCFPEELIAVTRTTEPWNKPRAGASAGLF